MAPLSRRGFIKIMSLASLSLFFSPLSAFAKEENEDFFHLRQMVTKNLATSRIILWHSRKNHKISFFYKASNELAYKKAPVSSKILTEDGERLFIHMVQLEDLSPDTTYTYQIQQDSFTSKKYSFTTLPLKNKAEYNILIFPDSQCSDGYITWQNTACAAIKKFPQSDLFINMGDLVDNGEAAYQWRQWFEAIASFANKIPFAPVMGNHEAYDLNWQFRLPKAYLSYFPLPANGYRDLKGYFYDFNIGNIHFIMLNTQEEELKGFQPNLYEIQKNWLRQVVRDSSQPWQVVCMHRDIINYENIADPSPLGDISSTGYSFMPLFDELGIHLVFTAHEHTYRRHGHIFNFSPSQSKGPVYIDTGVAGNCRYNVPKSRRFDMVMLPQPETNNYLQLKARKNALEISCYDLHGHLMDKCILVQ